MGENSAIAWTDHTFNPWIGCAKVSPGCDNCYAEAQDRHRKWTPEGWGAGKPRRRTSDANWRQPLKWNRAAEASGTRPRVFCASLADVFDNEVPRAWRDDLFALIRATPALDWIVLTKRIGNATKMLPPDWGDGYPNVWLLITVVNQHEADRDVPKLLDTPAMVRGLSIEPQLGPIDFYKTSAAMPFAGHPWRNGPILQGIHWIICGAESGPGRRPFDEDWARSLRDQCQAAGAAFFLKQLPGGKGPKGVVETPFLDGRTWTDMPRRPFYTPREIVERIVAEAETSDVHELPNLIDNWR